MRRTLLGHAPRERDLRHTEALLLRELLHPNRKISSSLLSSGARRSYRLTMSGVPAHSLYGVPNLRQVRKSVC